MIPKLFFDHNHIITVAYKPTSKHIRNITMTSVCSNWSDILIPPWPSTTVAGTLDHLSSTGPPSNIQSGIASLSDAWVRYWQPVNTPNPNTAIPPLTLRKSVGATVPRIDSVPSGLNRRRYPLPSRTTSSATSRPSNRYYTPSPSSCSKPRTQLESLRTRQGDAWSLQAVRTAFDVVEEMCATAPLSASTTPSSHGFSKIIASLDLPLQIATMESYKKDRRPYIPRRMSSDMSKTDVEDCYMSGALPSRKSFWGIKRRGGHIPASAISDVEEEHVRTRTARQGHEGKGRSCDSHDDI